jgi:hypothetical protein
MQGGMDHLKEMDYAKKPEEFSLIRSREEPIEYLAPLEPSPKTV